MAKFRARHDNWINDLVIWTYLFAIEKDLLIVPSHSFRERTIEDDLMSKNDISGLYALCRSKYPSMIIQCVFPDYSKLFNLKL